MKKHSLGLSLFLFIAGLVGLVAILVLPPQWTVWVGSLAIFKLMLAPFALLGAATPRFEDPVETARDAVVGTAAATLVGSRSDWLF